MNRRPLILIVFVVATILFLTPVQAADPSGDEMLVQAQNLSLEVPPMGAALPGSQESMVEMVGWLNSCSRALVGFFNDTMDLLGLSNTSYVKDMNKAFEPVLNNPPAIHK
ncbi:hypothetical protein [Methanoregula sp.]|jgi:hypothetical protein|uniref:hypothetical protein n=1 Tax=Methanoregula sp. TaxID=2052170 RepID=UPI00262C0D43|nr:hypothetical protein [Methanoregula sp.]MDD5142973.1 hypothetical protein [Methanoregula sp.]